MKSFLKHKSLKLSREIEERGAFLQKNSYKFRSEGYIADVKSIIQVTEFIENEPDDSEYIPGAFNLYQYYLGILSEFSDPELDSIICSYHLLRETYKTETYKNVIISLRVSYRIYLSKINPYV